MVEAISHPRFLRRISRYSGQVIFCFATLDTLSLDIRRVPVHLDLVILTEHRSLGLQGRMSEVDMAE